MLMTDAVALDGARVTADGYLAVEAKIARTGIQIYTGREMGRPSMDQVRVYRPESEVFDEKTMRSFAHRPVTDDHPPVLVDANNWSRHAKGMTGDSVIRDGDHVKVPFLLMDGAAIKAVQDGKQELSCGYVTDIVWSEGVTDAGEPYDAIQTKIRGNHLAIVARGRAGSSCRIGDSWAETKPLKESHSMADQLRAVMVDGLTIQTTDQGAQAIEKLQAKLDKKSNALEAKDGEIAGLSAAHTKALEQRDGEAAAIKAQHDAALQAKDGEIAALRTQIPDAATMDALLDARDKTRNAARAILGGTFDGKGMSDAEMKRKAVAKQLGDAAVAGKSDDYVGACFDTLSVVKLGAPARNILADAIAHQTPVATADAAAVAHEERLERYRNAWKTGQEGTV